MVVVHPSAVEFKHQDLGGEDENLQLKEVKLLAMTAWAFNVQSVIRWKLGLPEASQIFPPGKLLNFGHPKILSINFWFEIGDFRLIPTTRMDGFVDFKLMI